MEQQEIEQQGTQQDSDPNPDPKLTHFDGRGNARMVDVTDKAATEREATASGIIRMNKAAYLAVRCGTASKGDVIGVATVAGIMGAKKTSELIPLCHILPLTKCGITFEFFDGLRAVKAVCTVKVSGKTGVEMEALTGVNIALLTIYDMVKALDKNMVIGEIHLDHKSGGKSGEFWRRKE